MKTKYKNRIKIGITGLLVVMILAVVPFIYTNKDLSEEKVVVKEIAYKEPDQTNAKNIIVWDGLTRDELIERLNKNLYDTMSGTGSYFADYTIKTGMDPYLAISIINLETGCKWGCSYLTKACFNIGGLKGGPSCNGGSYMRFNSLEEGINGYLNILYNGYWSKGLTTPEAMNPKYAASTSWAEKVNNYYRAIENS